MTTRVICNILKTHGNCYIETTYPSKQKIDKIKQMLDCEINIVECSLVDGYLLIKEPKKEVNTNGMGINTR